MTKRPFYFLNNDDKLLSHNDKNVSLKIGEKILSFLPEDRNKQVIIVCIGTDRSTGDCLGPLVGTLLEDKKLNGFSLYGTLDDPIHALNLEEKLATINKEYEDPFIISIDACLGRVKSIGTFQIKRGPVKPGAAVNKQLPPVGDMHITGVVNVSGFMEFFVLQNTRLSLVMNMAKKIANGMYYANFSYYYSNDWLNILKKYENVDEIDL